MAMSRPVGLVLDRLEESLGDFGVGIVVYAGGVDVGDFLVEEAFAGADIPDAGQEFVEVIGAEGAAGLDALVVEGEAFDQQFAQACGGPLAEERSAWGTDAVADGEDDVKAVVPQGPADVAAALLANL